MGFAAAGLVAVAWLLAPWIGVDTYWLIQLVMIAVITLIVSGVNLSYGHAGELSLGQVAMFAVGAYLTGYMAIHGLNDLALTLVCAAAAAAVIGVASGVPGLRLGGWSLAMVSFFLVLLVPDFVSIFPGRPAATPACTASPAPSCSAGRCRRTPSTWPPSSSPSSGSSPCATWWCRVTAMPCASCARARPWPARWGSRCTAPSCSPTPWGRSPPAWPGSFSPTWSASSAPTRSASASR